MAPYSIISAYRHSLEYYRRKRDRLAVKGPQLRKLAVRTKDNYQYTFE